ncbi:unnamed protein product [Soboliphyme baturini]|uniref:Secreted protein n=1 Tax=Soboliphyme baturini TaxID=241478 RepID=A0A183IGC6_9BILA|nr:unnamed protein product [Soboliphyme baturini]
MTALASSLRTGTRSDGRDVGMRTGGCDTMAVTTSDEGEEHCGTGLRDASLSRSLSFSFSLNLNLTHGQSGASPLSVSGMPRTACPPFRNPRVRQNNGKYGMHQKYRNTTRRRIKS